MTVLKLYNQEAMAVLTVHSDSPATAKCQFHFKDEAYKNAPFSPKILYTIQQVKNWKNLSLKKSLHDLYTSGIVYIIIFI